MSRVLDLNWLEASVVEIALRSVADDFAKDSARSSGDQEALALWLEATEGLLNKYFGGADKTRYRLEGDEIVLVQEESGVQ